MWILTSPTSCSLEVLLVNAERGAAEELRRGECSFLCTLRIACMQSQQPVNRVQSTNGMGGGTIAAELPADNLPRVTVYAAEFASG